MPARWVSSGLFAVQRHRQRHGQQSEQSGELDDRIHGHRRGVLERVAHRVAHYAGVVQRSALGLEFGFHNLLGVVPCAAGIGHEDGLVQAEDRDGEQVADEEERLDEGEGKRREKDREEDVEHALLRILRADFNHLLGVFHAGLFRAFQLDVVLDELHRAIGAGGNRLGRRAGEPVNHRAAGDQAEHEGRVQQGQFINVMRQSAGEAHDDREDHGGCAHHGGADQHRLGRCLEGVARAVVFFQQVLGAFKVHVDAEFLLDLRLPRSESARSAKAHRPTVRCR